MALAPLPLIEALALEVAEPPPRSPRQLPEPQRGVNYAEMAAKGLAAAAGIGLCVAFPQVAIAAALLTPGVAFAPPPNEVWEVPRRGRAVQELLRHTGPAQRQLHSGGTLELPGGGMNCSRGYTAKDLQRSFYCPASSNVWTSELDLITPGRHRAVPGTFILGGPNDFELQNQSLKEVSVGTGADLRTARAVQNQGVIQSKGLVAHPKNTFLHVAENPGPTRAARRSRSLETPRTDPECRH